MKEKWLNLVLVLTNRIFVKKQRLLAHEGAAAVAQVISLIAMEIALAVVSVPLYLTLRTEKVTAFLSDKGGYAQVAFDYNLRRILTLTGLGIFLLIWLIKLLLIILIPNIFGPLQLYGVTDPHPPEVLTSQLQTVLADTQMQTSKEVASLLVPELLSVEKLKGGDYQFSGTGLPGSQVVLMLSDAQTAVYTGKVDTKGYWEIDHQDANFRLSEGGHVVLLFTYDEETGTRSAFSTEQYFRVRTSWLDNFVKNIDLAANWSVVIIIALGVFLTFLTI